MTKLWFRRFLLGVVILALFGILAGGELSYENGAEQSLQVRYVAKVQSAAGFIHTYVQSVLSHERVLAKLRLSGATISENQFLDYAQDMQFGPSLLLDARGRVLDVLPADPQLLGVDIAPKYRHLTIALAGRANVSQIVLSAVQHLPVVACAVPFQTPDGRRVVSGTFEISQSPLAAYLLSLRSLHHTVTYLADDQNRIIESGPVGTVASEIPKSLRALPSGSPYVSHGQLEVQAAVEGVPWKLIAVLPLSELYQPLNGSQRSIPWLILIGFVLLALALGIIVLRSWERQLQRVASAGVDVLTGLPARGLFDERTVAIFAAARRHQHDIAVMMVDIDNFKDVNDHYGHYVGDRVLKVIADCVHSSLRSEDLGGRWGGEEFSVVLPYTDLVAATYVAERLRKAVEDISLDVGRELPLKITVSIGVAALSTGQDPVQLLPFADEALFRAKAGGRNRVERYTPDVAANTLD